MVQIVGKYQFVSFAPNFEDYLKALKVPEAMITTITGQKKTITISENGGLWTFHNTDAAGKVWSSSFKMGEPFDENTFTGTVLKSVARREGDKIIIESEVNGSSHTKVNEFTDAGFTEYISSPEAGAIKTSVVHKRI